MGDDVIECARVLREIRQVLRAKFDVAHARLLGERAGSGDGGTRCVDAEKVAACMRLSERDQVSTLTATELEDPATLWRGGVEA